MVTTLWIDFFFNFIHQEVAFPPPFPLLHFFFFNTSFLVPEPRPNFFTHFIFFIQFCHQTFSAHPASLRCCNLLVPLFPSRNSKTSKSFLSEAFLQEQLKVQVSSSSVGSERTFRSWFIPRINTFFFNIYKVGEKHAKLFKWPFKDFEEKTHGFRFS